MECLDKFGIPLNLGDEVIFAIGSQQDDNLYVGTIIRIVNDNLVKIENSRTKRKVLRASISTLSLNATKDQYPELFI